MGSYLCLFTFYTSSSLIFQMWKALLKYTFWNFSKKSSKLGKIFISCRSCQRELGKDHRAHENSLCCFRKVSTKERKRKNFHCAKWRGHDWLKNYLLVYLLLGFLLFLQLNMFRQDLHSTPIWKRCKVTLENDKANFFCCVVSCHFTVLLH